MFKMISILATLQLFKMCNLLLLQLGSYASHIIRKGSVSYEEIKCKLIPNLNCHGKNLVSLWRTPEWSLQGLRSGESVARVQPPEVAIWRSPEHSPCCLGSRVRGFATARFGYRLQQLLAPVHY